MKSPVRNDRFDVSSTVNMGPPANAMLIYGANGFSGRLLAQAACARGLGPILCGRDEQKVSAVARELGLPYRVGTLEAASLQQALRGVRVMVNAAGPFSRTTAPLVDACIAAGVHYLDISGEVRSVVTASERHAKARAAGVMVMPAVGFDVLPSDCLALHVARRARNPRRLAIGITGLQSASRGSARTLIDEIGRPVPVRRDGRLVAIAPASLEHRFDYGNGPCRSIAVSWADVVSAFFSTGAPNIEVYFEATPSVRAALETSRHIGHWLASPPARRWLETWVQLLPEGPGETERANARAVIVVEADGDDGHRATRLTTPEVYSFTAMAASAVLARVLDGDWQPGFQTPARVYGADFVLSFPDVFREDLS